MFFAGSSTRIPAVKDIPFTPTFPLNFRPKIQPLLCIFSWMFVRHLKFSTSQSNPPTFQRPTGSSAGPISVSGSTLSAVSQSSPSSQSHSLAELSATPARSMFQIRPQSNHFSAPPLLSFWSEYRYPVHKSLLYLLILFYLPFQTSFVCFQQSSHSESMKT